MPLETPQLEAAIVSIFTQMRGITANPEQAAQQFASELAHAIEVFVKTGLVTVAGPSGPETGNIT